MMDFFEEVRRLAITALFIQQVDTVVAAIVAGGTTSALSAQQALTEELTTFNRFRTGLRDFLSRHALSTDLCVRDDAWCAFLEAYARVIQDGSLFCSLTTVEAVTLTTAPLV